jgi:hypothetical protein
MRKKRLRNKSGAELEKLVSRHESNAFLASALGGIGLTFFAASFSYYVLEMRVQHPQFFSIAFTYFAVGITIFAVVIAGVAGFIRHANREIIVLKQRLAGIYLAALKKSALNPQPRSSVSHE